MKGKIFNKLFGNLLVALLAATLLTAGCDEEQKAPEVNVDTGSQASGVEATSAFLSLSGRVVHEVQDSDGPSDLPQYAGVAGARVYTYIGGGIKQATTNADGFFEITGIPWVVDGLRENDNLVDTWGWELNVYVDAPGYILDWNWGIIDYFTVNIGELAGKTKSGGVITVGNVIVYGSNYPLTVTSNLIHESPSLISNHLAWGDTLNGNVNDVYLKDGATNITLTFNYPIDTTYTGNTFVEMFDPMGVPVAYTGTWDSTKKIFTINPAANLVGDNDSNTKYAIYIREIVRAFRTIGSNESIEELRDVVIHFNVLKDTKDTPLASPVVMVAPQDVDADDWFIDDWMEIGGQDVNGNMETWGWSFGSPWNMDEGSTPIMFDASNNPGAVYYELLFRSMADNTIGEWEVWDTYWPEWDADPITGMIYTSIEVAWMAGWEFSPGEEVHVLVTSVDVDGNKSKISASTPLVFTDTFGPVMENGQENWWDYPDTVREGTNSITTDAIVYFHEDMDTNDPAAAPVLASVSGAGTFTAGTGTWWSRDTWASEGITFDINVPSTTLSQAYYPSQTYLKVADASGFGQWDYILIGEPGTANWMDQTICDINTLENLIVLCGTSAYAYPSGSVVRLIEQDDNNASDFVAELANPVIIGDNSITLAAGQGAKFYPGMGVEVYAMDDSMWPSWVYVGWLDVDSISGDTINLGSSSYFVAAAGSKVVFDNLGWVPYHDLRGTQEFNGAGQILADIVLDASSLTTTIAANTQNNSIGGSDPNPQKIVVQSSAGFQSNDIIYIEGTYISKTATTGTDGGGAVNTLDVGTNHGFMEGDRVIIREKDVSANLSAAVANGANSITLASSVEVVSGEPATLTSDPFITRMSAAAVAAATDISVSSVTGLVVGMNITIDDGNQGIVTRNITAIAGTTLTLDLALGLDFAADTVVQRGTWSEVVNIDPAGTAGTALVAGTTVAVSTLVLNHPASARLEVNRTSQQLNVTVVNGSVITLSANLGWHHKPKVDLLSAMERRTVWYVEDEYTIMLTTGLNYGHHPGAAVRRHNTAVVKLNQDLWTARVGDTIIMDNDGQTWTTGDRYEVTLESINSIDNTITISVPRSGVIYNDTVRLTFMGDAIHVSGAADKQGNVMGTATGTSGTAYTFNRGHLLNMASGIVR